jgi:hypothetical protein
MGTKPSATRAPDDLDRARLQLVNVIVARAHQIQQVRFLNELAQTGDIAGACTKGNVPRPTVDAWAAADARFAGAWAEAQREGLDKVDGLSDTDVDELKAVLPDFVDEPRALQFKAVIRGVAAIHRKTDRTIEDGTPKEQADALDRLEQAAGEFAAALEALPHRARYEAAANLGQWPYHSRIVSGAPADPLDLLNRETPMSPLAGGVHFRGLAELDSIQASAVNVWQAAERALIGTLPLVPKWKATVDARRFAAADLAETFYWATGQLPHARYRPRATYGDRYGYYGPFRDFVRLFFLKVFGDIDGLDVAVKAAAMDRTPDALPIIESICAKFG